MTSSTWAASFGYYAAYYLYIVIASLMLPGKKVLGHPQPKRGPRLSYHINGFRLTVLTIVGFFLFGGVFPSLKSIALFRGTFWVDNFWTSFSVVNIVALLVSILLYLKGKYGVSVLGEPVDRHSHGSFGLDFWVGRELNPRLGTYDIKFNAYRVGMIFWLVLNLSFLAKQLEETGIVSYRMLGYQLTTGFYVLDYFWFEERMLTTWDIINEEFGYMLIFGDYVFIPFAFCVQCHFLLGMSDYSNPLVSTVIQFAFFILGYYIFRTSNSQKNQFKQNPELPINGKKPQTFEGKLLISGFWGYGRHMNYTGDLIMALAYSLPCGFSAGIKPYFYFIYLSTLLLHRAYRDDAKCQEKYGDLWKRYCQRVPYVFIPFKADYALQFLGKTLYSLTNKPQEQTKSKSN